MPPPTGSGLPTTSSEDVSGKAHSPHTTPNPTPVRLLITSGRAGDGDQLFFSKGDVSWVWEVWKNAQVIRLVSRWLEIFGNLKLWIS
jgi:hypothetical protein